MRGHLTMDIKKWTVVGAASVLGLGILGGGAVATASTLQLNDTAGANTGVNEVATDVPRFVGSPAAPSAVSATSAPSPVSAQSPVSAESPVSAQSPVSADSPVSAPSPVSPVSAQSPASADSPASAGSAD